MKYKPFTTSDMYSAAYLMARGKIPDCQWISAAHRAVFTFDNTAGTSDIMIKELENRKDLIHGADMIEAIDRIKRLIARLRGNAQIVSTTTTISLDNSDTTAIKYSS